MITTKTSKYKAVELTALYEIVEEGRTLLNIVYCHGNCKTCEVKRLCDDLERCKKHIEVKANENN